MSEFDEFAAMDMEFGIATATKEEDEFASIDTEFGIQESPTVEQTELFEPEPTVTEPTF